MKNHPQCSIVERIGSALLQVTYCVSFFLIWSLLIRFPEDITGKLIFLLLCPVIVSTLVFMIYVKEKRTLEHNLWKRMGQQGKII